METIDDLFIKRKVYISTIGRIGAILSGLMIYFTVFGLIKIVVFNHNPIFRNYPFEEHPDISQSFFRVFVLFSIMYGLTITFGSFFLISSIGLLKFKEWGRKIFIITAWIFISLIFCTIIVYIINSGMILSAIVTENTPLGVFDTIDELMKKVLSIRIVSYGILLVILLRTLFQIVRRLRMEAYKRLFT